ncbi:MAG: response regulator [Eubacterium sp.]|nr:response regulator [Eubacterium sp.]
MREGLKGDKLFQASNLMILVGNSVLSGILLIRAITAKWEIWPLVIIILCVACSWTLHLRQSFAMRTRMWAYALMVMGTFFYFGVHSDSRFDMLPVMAVIIMLFTMTGMKWLIYLAQFTYYLTYIYSLIAHFYYGGTANSELVSRSILHLIILTMIAWFSRIIIKKWEQVLTETSDEIAELTDTTDRLDDFLANASHEIRTPVNAVIGLTEVCLDRDNSEEQRHDLLAIQHAGRRVGNQMSDILDYSEIDRNRLATTNEDYMLSSLLNDVVVSLRPYLSSEIEFVLDVDPSIPAVMNSDVQKIKKIIWHLTMNGLKYTREGGVYVRITADEMAYGVNLCIDVSDTGIGMNDEELTRAFDKFYQADSGRSRSGSGLGLGLAIVNGFVRALGGFITIESKVGSGTHVHVCLPQKVIDPGNCVWVNNKEEVSLAAFFSFGKYPIPAVREYYNSMIRNVVRGMGVALHGVDSVENLKKVIDSVYISHIFIGMKEYETDIDYIESVAARIPVYITADRGYMLPENSRVRFLEKPLYCFPIVAAINGSSDMDAAYGSMRCPGVRALVVDDEPMNLSVATSLFTGYGMQVITAGSGKEAVKKCEEDRFDIIFMDHMMPEMDGVECARQIRMTIRGDHRPPIIALTANTVSTARELFKREGFDGFVGKPIERVELERVLRQVLKDRITYVDVESDDKNDTDEQMRDMGKEEKEMDNGFYDELKAVGVDTALGLEYCADDEDFYRMMLSDFAENSDESVRILNESLASKDMETYEIRVHSVKSTSRLIGAMGIGDAAESLEHAANAGNVSEGDHDVLIDKVKELAGVIRKGV